MADESKPLTLATFFRENMLWFFGLLPFILAGFRILTASRGHNEVLLQLVQNLNIVQLMLATVLPLLPLVIFWGLVLLYDWMSRNREIMATVPEWTYFPALGGMAGIFLYMTTIQFVVSIIILLIAFWKRKRLKKKLILEHGPDALTQWTVKLIVPEYVVFALVTAFTSNFGMWMPAQTVKVKDADPVTAYVLGAEAGEWITFMDDQRKIYNVLPEKVESITSCTSKQSWFLRPLFSVAKSNGPNPTCSGAG